MKALIYKTPEIQLETIAPGEAPVAPRVAPIAPGGALQIEVRETKEMKILTQLGAIGPEGALIAPEATLIAPGGALANRLDVEF